jgi:polyadenylation factor subunit 2
MLYWDLYSPTNSVSAPSNIPSLNVVNPSEPRAILSQAHDSNVWSLAFHPLGHLLASASNDHTTRFWSRERPGDSTSVFSGGGEKPPEVGEGEGEEDDAWGEGALPGLSVPGLYSQNQGSGSYGGPAGWNDQSGSGDGAGIPGMLTGGANDSDMYDDFGSLPGMDSVPGNNSYGQGGGGYGGHSQSTGNQGPYQPQGEGDAGNSRRRSRWGP